MQNKPEWEAVTEVGTFGSMAIKDPTVRSVEQLQPEKPIDDQIKEAIQRNAGALRK